MMLSLHWLVLTGYHIEYLLIEKLQQILHVLTFNHVLATGCRHSIIHIHTYISNVPMPMHYTTKQYVHMDSYSCQSYYVIAVTLQWYH